MEQDRRECIDGIFYTHGELRTLHYLVHAGEAGLRQVAVYCGVVRSTAHTYIDMLRRKKLVAWDGKKSSVPSDFWCTDKQKAEAILKKAPRGIIDRSKKITPVDIKIVKVSRSYKARIDGVWFSLQELRVLKCIIQAPRPIAPSEIRRQLNISSAGITHALLQALLRKELIDKKVGAEGEDRYSYSYSQDVKALLRKINKVLDERR